jgi:hypothetical protein
MLFITAGPSTSAFHHGMSRLGRALARPLRRAIPQRGLLLFAILLLKYSECEVSSVFDHRSISFAFTTATGSVGGVTFECALAPGDGSSTASADAAQFKPCASPVVYDGLQDGGYDFFIRAQGEEVADSRSFIKVRAPPLSCELSVGLPLRHSDMFSSFARTWRDWPTCASQEGAPSTGARVESS